MKLKFNENQLQLTVGNKKNNITYDLRQMLGQDYFDKYNTLQITFYATPQSVYFDEVKVTSEPKEIKKPIAPQNREIKEGKWEQEKFTTNVPEYDLVCEGYICGVKYFNWFRNWRIEILRDKIRRCKYAIISSDILAEHAEHKYDKINKQIYSKQCQVDLIDLEQKLKSLENRLI